MYGNQSELVHEGEDFKRGGSSTSLILPDDCTVMSQHHFEKASHKESGSHVTLKDEGVAMFEALSSGERK